MSENQPVPSLYEWAGGMPVFIELFDKFYDKVLADDVLEPVFKYMSSEHRLHVAHFVAEVLGATPPVLDGTAAANGGRTPAFRQP